LKYREDKKEVIKYTTNTTLGQDFTQRYSLKGYQGFSCIKKIQ